MKKNFGLILAIALGLSALLLTIAFQSGWVNARPFAQQERAGAPTIVSYQGQIWDGDTPYNGTGYFKFAILDLGGTTTYWSNDGTSTGGTEPTESISLEVDNGLFNILLGDTSLTNMIAVLDETVFSDPDTNLRIWFSADGFAPWALLPDQRIAAVPYALQAQVAMYADDADTLDTKHAAAFQLRVTQSCIAGSSIRHINTDGTVTCETDDNNWYTNGTGILLVGNTFSADPDYLQRRVSTSCVEGSAIKTINSDGSVICESIPNNATFSLSTVDSTGHVGIYSSLAIGTDGLGLISYYDATQWSLKVAHCADTNCSSATSYTMDNVGSMGTFTSLTIGTDGFGLISYLDSSIGDLKVAHCNNTTCSSATTYTLDSTGNVGYYNSIAIGADGFGLISYYDDTNGYLKVAHCNNTACSSGASSNILDSTGSVGSYTSIAIGSDGLGLISYYDATNGNLKVAHCSNTACSSATSYTLDSTGNVGTYTSLAIGTDGFGLISYYNGSNGDLNVAHCSNTVCSSASTYILDSTGAVGENTSIAIGTDGLGLISYHDVSNHDLKVAHCSNAACSSASTYALDLTDLTGYTPSIAIGTDRLGLISYFDQTNFDLKVAHCSNNFCMPIDWGN